MTAVYRRFSRFDLAALAITLGFIVLAAGYALAIPLFEGPDEVSHFLYSHNLANEGVFPVIVGRQEMFDSGSVQRHHPPLYYLVGAALIAGIDRDDLPFYTRFNPLASIGIVNDHNLNVHLHPVGVPSTGNTPAAVYLLRAWSIVLAAGTIFIVYRIGLLLFSPLVGVLAALITAANPQFAFIGGMINNDSLVTFLMAVGVAWCAWVWRKRRIGRREMLIIGLTLAGIVLTKNNGLGLIPVVSITVLAGAASKRWTWRTALATLGVSAVLMIVLAGWWYARNLTLYGDIFALSSTLSVWGRGPTDGLTGDFIVGEAGSIYTSFWMVLGYFNILGPGWLYPYTAVILVIALIGVYTVTERVVSRDQALPADRSVSRDDPPPVLFGLVLCGLVCITVGGLVIYSSQQISSSQGRIVFPALAGLAPLIGLGWVMVGKRYDRVMGLLVVPLIIAGVMGIVQIAPASYARAVPVASVPATARAIDAAAEGLRLVGYALDQVSAAPGERVSGVLYVQGTHPDDPRLIVRAIDPLTGNPVGGVELFPGMAPVSTFDSAVVYGIPFHFRLDIVISESAGPIPQPPVQLRLLVDWRTVENRDAAQGRYLAWDAGSPPLLDGWTRIDPGYSMFASPVTCATFGSPPVIRLDDDYCTGVVEDQTLGLWLDWMVLSPPTDGDLRLAVILVDAAGNVIVQADGPTLGLPSSAWVSGLQFKDRRTVTVPEGAMPDSVLIGWYSGTDGTRLPLDPESLDSTRLPRWLELSNAVPLPFAPEPAGDDLLRLPLLLR